MAACDTRTLLGAVRRRLWRGQFVAVTRVASWGSTALMLLAIVTGLFGHPVPIHSAVLALATLWASMAAWATWRRPSDPACALWSDRHLGGASAFTTLLEVRQGNPQSTDAQAVRWLEQWAATRVPEGLRLLAERKESLRLSRPLLAMLVCAALATVVLSRPGLEHSSPKQLGASSAAETVERPTTADEPVASKELAREVASALRAAPSRSATARREPDREPEARPSLIDDGTGSAAIDAGTAQPVTPVTAGKSSSGAVADTGAKTGTAQSAGAGSGRDPGNSRDARADAGRSRALQGTIPVKEIEPRSRRTSPDRHTDRDQPATYDEDLTMRAAAAQTGPAPAAATPPPATAAALLTPTEASYVQAWMKSSWRLR